MKFVTLNFLPASIFDSATIASPSFFNAVLAAVFPSTVVVSVPLVSSAKFSSISAHISLVVHVSIR